MGCRTIAGTILVLSIVCATSPCSADSIIDVWDMPPLSNHGRVEGDNQLAQTFVVGLSGMMTGLDLPIARHSNPLAIGDVLILILPTAGGDPTTNLGLALTSLVVPATHWGTTSIGSDPEAYRHVEFATPFVVNTGDLLSIVVRHAPTVVPDRLYRYGSNDEHLGTYTPGQRYERIGSAAPWIAAPRQDFAFVTYVDPDAAPIPSPPPCSCSARGWSASRGGGSGGSSILVRARPLVITAGATTAVALGVYGLFSCQRAPNLTI